MVNIPDPVIKIIRSQESHKVLTTVSDTNEPHSIVCGSLMMSSPDTLVAGEVFMHKTSKNLVANPNAEVLVWQGKYGYILKVVCTSRITEGEVFDKMSAAVAKMNLKITAVWEFKVTSIWDASASYSSGDQVV